MTYICLHGFMGEPEDWQAWPEPKSCPSLSDYPINRGLRGWAKAFNSDPRWQTLTNPILVGYSLGGRLALHAITEENHPWKQAILLSTHPGFKTAQEKQERLKHDQQWAHRFLTEPWDTVWADWNAQSIFSGTFQPRTPNPKLAADQLNFLSLGHQDYLEPALPTHWITGARDTKFTALCAPFSHHTIIPNAGHRLLNSEVMQKMRAWPQFFA
ncbi:MAG: hypothetical protein KDK65_02885 [Chlamydiia bacterium]|nr:hypothetical protein [Chlamydiia bacterium]